MRCTCWGEKTDRQVQKERKMGKEGEKRGKEGKESMTEHTKQKGERIFERK